MTSPLPWGDDPVSHADAGRGHGRTRTIQVCDAPQDQPFPHVSQVYLIERHITVLDGTPLSEVAALGVTSLAATRVGPEAIAGLVRGQWAIESLHWLRDTAEVSEMVAQVVHISTEPGRVSLISQAGDLGEQGLQFQ